MKLVHFISAVYSFLLSFAGGVQAAVLVSSDGAWSTNELITISKGGLQSNSNSGGTFGSWGGASFNANAESHYLDMETTVSNIQHIYTPGYTYSYKASAAAALANMMTNQVVYLLADGAPVSASRVAGKNYLGTFGSDNRNSVYGYYSAEAGDPLIGQTVGMRLTSEGIQSRFRADGDSSLRVLLTSHAGFDDYTVLPQSSTHAIAGLLFETEFEMDAGGLVASENVIGLTTDDGSLIVTNATDSYFRMNLNDTGGRNAFKLNSDSDTFQELTIYRLDFRAFKSIDADPSQNEVHVVLGGSYTNTINIGTSESSYSTVVDSDETGLAGSDLRVEFVPAGTGTVSGINQYRVMDLSISADSTTVDSGLLYYTAFETNGAGLVETDYVLDMIFSGDGTFGLEDGVNCYVLPATAGSAASCSVVSADDTFRQGTTYEVSFQARSLVRENPSLLTVSAGSFTTNIVVGRGYVDCTLLVDADAVGISGEPLSIELVPELSPVSNEYRIKNLKLAAVSQAIGCWFEDSNLGTNGGIPPDFESRFYEPQLSTWTNALETMEVYYLRYATYRDHLADNVELKTRMAEVFNAYGIKVALDDTEPTWGHAKYNYNTPNYQNSINALQDLENHGWNLCAVGMQSVLSKPWSGGDYAMSWRILDVVEYIKQVKPHFPDLEYGVIDALPVKGLEYKSHYADLKNAVEAEGYTLDFFEQDFPIDKVLTGERTHEEMIDAERFARHALGCKSGLFLTSSRGGNDSDELWRSDVISGLDQHIFNGAAPERITLAAWYPHPVYTAPDETDPLLNPNGSTMLGTLILMEEKVRETGFTALPDSSLITVKSDNPQVDFYINSSEVLIQWDSLTGREYNLYSTTNLLEGFLLMKGGMSYPQGSFSDSSISTNKNRFYKLDSNEQVPL
ncbi:hypothetical protein [Pontiella desulfatans]|nr:hypothetical protein [Pontiella desulfatans]